MFVNGHLAPELSSVSEQDDGVKIMGLADALASEPARVGWHLFRVAQEKPARELTQENRTLVTQSKICFYEGGKGSS